VLWYLSNLCRILGVDLEQVAISNIEKLRKRYPDGFVKGGGIRESLDKVMDHYDETLRNLGPE
jgi:hypothetical protein